MVHCLFYWRVHFRKFTKSLCIVQVKEKPRTHNVVRILEDYVELGRGHLAEFCDRGFVCVCWVL